jgi:hypothetical protein
MSCVPDLGHGSVSDTSISVMEGKVNFETQELKSGEV